MFYIVISLCAVISTIFVSRYWATQTRLVEKNINETIARKLLTSKHSAELEWLKEENAVMRNLLLDIVENESSLIGITCQTPASEKTLRINARTQRRRELLGEAVYVLQNVEGPQLPVPHLTE